jgi:hypothetical protein
MVGKVKLAVYSREERRLSDFITSLNAKKSRLLEEYRFLDVKVSSLSVTLENMYYVRTGKVLDRINRRCR